MEPAVLTEQDIEIIGRGGWRGPSTWGQQYMYEAYSTLGGSTSYINLVLDLPLPPGTTVASALGALRDLLLRHEALRTRFDLLPDGRLNQQVLDPATLEVRPAPAHAVGDDREGPAGVDLLARRWPIAACLRAYDGHPAGLRLLLTHVAVDDHALGLLREDFRRILAGGPAADPVTGRGRPRDRAAAEATPQGQAIADRSLRFIEDQLASAPRTMFPGPPREALAPRYRMAELVSPAGLVALRAVSARLHVFPGAVLSTVYAALLAARTGHDRCTLLYVLGNRMNRKDAGYVGQLTQPTVLTLSGLDGRLETTVRSAAGLILDGTRTGRYPVRRFLRTVRDVDRRRGIRVDLGCTFNLVRDQRPGRPGSGPPPPPGPSTPLRDRTTLRWGPGADRENYRSALRAWITHDHLLLVLQADTWVLPAPELRILLYDMEEVLRRLAVGDIGPVDVSLDRGRGRTPSIETARRSIGTE